MGHTQCHPLAGNTAAPDPHHHQNCAHPLPPHSDHSSTAMAYTHDNRVKYVVRYLYDIDNNGVLDKNDFKCLAVRNTILENLGNFPTDRFKLIVRSWRTCGTKLLNLPTLIRMGRKMLMSSRPSSRTSSRLLTSTVMAP